MMSSPLILCFTLQDKDPLTALCVCTCIQTLFMFFDKDRFYYISRGSYLEMGMVVTGTWVHVIMIFLQNMQL